ncbi:MAG: FAD-binding oxidoreductase [Saprospiraceae bacterium]|nr:FAD-binding oxidoreductase [Saprospiraceae bacterium]
MKTSVVEALEKVLAPNQILVNEAVSERSHHIWHMDKPLEAVAVVLPKNTEEVAEILKICHAHNQAVVVHGGMTNMVGSTETQREELVISMEKMNQMEEFDEVSRTITVQAGVILQDIQEMVREKNLLFPLNFGAKGSAQIGGVISTNAGGMRVVKYGMTRHLVLGVEAVLADGTIINSLKKIIKDNSGFDLKQLFIGSEGTLGLVTRAVLKLLEAPTSRNTAFIGLESYEQVIALLKYVDAGLGGNLSCFELIWNNTFRGMTSPPAQVKPPLPYDYSYYVLLESLGNQPEADRQLLEQLLVDAQEQGMIEDATMAFTDSDLNWFFKIREDVDVLVNRCRNDQHFDISLPIASIGDTLNKTLARLKALPEVEEVFAFGHVADGNIHLIVGKSEETPELIKAINQIVYAPLQALGGSVSAEHGIGVHKKPYLALSRTSAEIELMQLLKKSMDPKGILNRGKVIDV